MFSWYKYLIVSLVFSHLGFWSGNFFLIAPFPDLCLLVPFYPTEHKDKESKVRETAYNTLVRPQLEYAAPVWDPHTKEKILQLEKVQRRAARWTTSNYDYRSSTTSTVNNLGWRTLELRRADARLVLFFKIVQGLVAVPLPDYIRPPNRISRHCHSMKFQQLQTTKNYYKYSFYPLAIVQWNALPVDFASLSGLVSFKVSVSKLQHSRP